MYSEIQALRKEVEGLAEMVDAYKKECNEVTPCTTCKHSTGPRDPEICCDDGYTYDNYEPMGLFAKATAIIDEHGEG
jgi:hypothetical protein